MLRSASVIRKKAFYDRSQKTRNPFADWRSRLVKEFRYWIVIKNSFPYDAVATRHDLLIPKRKFAHAENARLAELKEIAAVRKWAASRYDAILENFLRFRSVHDHFHLHLLVFKPGSR